MKSPCHFKFLKRSAFENESTVQHRRQGMLHLMSGNGNWGKILQLFQVLKYLTSQTSRKKPSPKGDIVQNV